jgi:hypothetical protein
MIIYFSELLPDRLNRRLDQESCRLIYTLMGPVSKDEAPDDILSLPCSFFHIVILYNHLTWLFQRLPFCSKFQQLLCCMCRYFICDLVTLLSFLSVKVMLF